MKKIRCKHLFSNLKDKDNGQIFEKSFDEQTFENVLSLLISTYWEKIFEVWLNFKISKFLVFPINKKPSKG